MNNQFFIIPKAVYHFCLIPALVIIVASIIIAVWYRRKKDTKHYGYTLNYIYNIVSMLLSLLLLPLLLGYSMAMIEIINRGLIQGMNHVIMLILFLLPLIPLVTLIIVFINYVKGLSHKKEDNLLV